VWDQFTFKNGTNWLNDMYPPYGPDQYNNSGYLQGTSMPDPVTTQNPALRIRFVTKTNGATGFAFQYTAVARPPYSAGIFDTTKLPIVAQRGYVQSIGYSVPATQYQMAFFSAPPGLWYTISLEDLYVDSGSSTSDQFVIYNGPFDDTTQLGSTSYLMTNPNKVIYDGDTYGNLASIFTIKHSQFVLELTPASSGTSGSYFSFYFNVFNATTKDQYVNTDLGTVQVSGLTQGSTNSQTSSGSNNNAMYALVSLVALPVLLLAVAVVIVKRRKSIQQSADQQFYETPSSIPNPKLEALVRGDLESPEFRSVPNTVATPEVGQGYPSTPLRVEI
jgi:hypothetical protein